jgi:hypothetical protein
MAPNAASTPAAAGATRRRAQAGRPAWCGPTPRQPARRRPRRPRRPPAPPVAACAAAAPRSRASGGAASGRAQKARPRRRSLPRGEFTRGAGMSDRCSTELKLHAQVRRAAYPNSARPRCTPSTPLHPTQRRVMPRHPTPVTWRRQRVRQLLLQPRKEPIKLSQLPLQRRAERLAHRAPRVGGVGARVNVRLHRAVEPGRHGVARKGGGTVVGTRQLVCVTS